MEPGAWLNSNGDECAGGTICRDTERGAGAAEPQRSPSAVESLLEVKPQRGGVDHTAQVSPRRMRAIGRRTMSISMTTVRGIE
jgi:hypothetical protein